MIRFITAVFLCVSIFSTASEASGIDISAVVPELRAKADAILAACPGTKVISAIRHTRIRGSRRMSLHASGRAVDLRGNPRCIYAQLEGWPGGYSIDYGRVRHVHISLGGREDGLRFAHRGGRRAARRSVPRETNGTRRIVEAVPAISWPAENATFQGLGRPSRRGSRSGAE